MAVRLRDVEAAAERIRPWIHRTPVLTSSWFDERCRAEVFFKCENFQKAGAFKMRGAMNALLELREEEARPGVVTHSSGNFGQALALAARSRGIPAWVVMPENAPTIKREAVLSYGAEVVICAPTLEARVEGARRVVEEKDAVFIHSYDDENIIAGQGTAALELLEEVQDLDLVLAPVGGGGLLSGTAVACRDREGGPEVLGAEPEGADDAHRSLKEGRLLPSVDPRTIADGLLAPLGERTFPLISRHVSDIVLVPDEATLEALHLVWERMKIVIEPSAAVAVAALLSPGDRAAGRRVGILLSGGNVSLRLAGRGRFSPFPP